MPDARKVVIVSLEKNTFLLKKGEKLKDIAKNLRWQLTGLDAKQLPQPGLHHRFK